MAERARRLRLTRKKIIILIAAAAVLTGGVFAVRAVTSGRQVSKNMSEVATDTVQRGDVSLTITGSAAVEPYERYEIISKVSGDITACPYEVGDIVTEGATLYQFDTSETDISMQKQQISLENSQRNYEKALKDADKLSITAKASGVISNLDIKVGDDVKSGTKIADINNTVQLEVTLPFMAVQAESISVGDSAYISSSLHMSNVEGTVIHKSATPYAGSDGSRLVDVTIAFENPGAFSEGMTVGGSVKGLVSPDSGSIKMSDSGAATAEAEGTISKLYCSNGDYVEKGAVIAAISSDSVTDSIKSSKNNYESSKLNMAEARETLDDYTLTAPISGTVITKNAKAGDTIDRTNSSQTLMVIADVSKLKFSLEIDELDVNKVLAGQKVEVTCDALPEETFAGEITNISVEGTSQNGVTSYTAEVVIAEPGNLRPSMNIDASVVVQSSQNTLFVPSEDVKTIGNMYYVFKKSDGKDNSGAKGEMPEGMTPPEGMERPADGEMPEGMTPPEGMERPADGEMPEGMTPPEGMEMPADGEKPQRRMPEAPEGFETVIVTVGVVGDEYTEILSGLSEGDEVYAQSGASSSSNDMRGMMGAMGAMHGGMPAGGMGGPPGGMR